MVALPAPGRSSSTWRQSDGARMSDKESAGISASNEAGGGELIEFLGLLPMMLFVGLLIWQLFIGGYAIVVGANAAREGARVLATCKGTYDGARQQAKNAAPEFLIDADPSRGGSSVQMKVTVWVPAIVGEGEFPITMQTTMRQEKCP